MPKFAPKPCVECAELFTPKGPAAKYCEYHADKKHKEANVRSTAKYRKNRGLIQRPGVGKGGNNAKGSEDSQYQTGIAYFQTNRRKLKAEIRYCENCGKDLLTAGRYEWVIHHVNHDRTVNTDDNFQLLCKRCHQIEHDCASNFNV